MAHDRVTRSLMRTLNAHDPDSAAHSERIGSLSRAFLFVVQQNKKIDSSHLTLEKIYSGGQTHDIGKWKIPAKILTKNGKLTDKEFAKIKNHTSLGTKVLGGKDRCQVAINMAEGHHERWDGNGYPNKLKGNAIPLEAQICSIVDVYDALASKRAYKDAMPHEQVVAELMKGAGTQFNPALVDIFVQHHHKFKALHQGLHAQQLQVRVREKDFGILTNKKSVFAFNPVAQRAHLRLLPKAPAQQRQGLFAPAPVSAPVPKPRPAFAFSAALEIPSIHPAVHAKHSPDELAKITAFPKSENFATFQRHSVKPIA